MTPNSQPSQPAGPLHGIRVLELGQLIAGPYAGTLLGWFGAEVIKIEPPSGDPIRRWRGMQGDTSLWWRGMARNKRLVCLDLRREEARELVRRMVSEVDVVIENFRPGRMEQWGLGPEVLRAARPELVLCRVSGHGQTGPHRDRAGYASVAEARGGLRYLTGEPSGPTMRANLSLGDSLAGLQAALGIVLALLHRERGGGGQVVDVSLLESVFTMLEAVVSEAAAGQPRNRSGGTITGIVPSGAWPCQDGEVVIGANGESVFQRLCATMGRPELAEDPRFQGNLARCEHQTALDAAIGAWTCTLPVAEVVERLAAAGVPAGPVQSPTDLLADPQLRSRGMFWEVEVGGETVVLPELGPKLSASPGRTEHAGGALGAQTDAVLRELLGLDDDELARVHAAGLTGR
jgi:crotonobetainyl-CoA:carnitine CoA-transferase CaiB-like acyl-CoA transferase